ncbi:hypothetical protein BGZ76_002160 [Entomortierella beljakovae]|nr:hypothetical protein BGZ76_002160 [Entomortierella beljakovae]
MLVFHVSTSSMSSSNKNAAGCSRDAEFSIIRWKPNPNRNNHNDIKLDFDKTTNDNTKDAGIHFNNNNNNNNDNNDLSGTDGTAPEVEEKIETVKKTVDPIPFPETLDQEDGIQYVTYLPYAGITNQFYGMLRGMEVAKALGRTLIIPPITASSHDKSKQNQPWSKFLDLEQFQELTGAKVVEFHELRDAEKDQYSMMECKITCGFGSKRTIDFTAKGFLKQWNMNTTLTNLPVDANKLDTIVRLLAPYRRDKFICISNTYKVSVADKSEWERFGQYLHFTEELESFVQEYLDSHLAKPEPSYDYNAGKEVTATQKYIAIHVRRGDFDQYCRENFPGPKLIHCFPSTEEISGRVDKIQSKNNPSGSLDEFMPVFVATNERRPEELKKFADLGWTYLDHDQMQTVEKLGIFGPMMVDQVFMAHAQALIGIQMSTFSRETATTTTAVEESTVKGKPIGPAPYNIKDLIITRAIIPEVVQKTWTNNMEEWAKGVPLPLYHEREEHLASTAFSSDNLLVTWVLVPKPDADVTEEYKLWALCKKEISGENDKNETDTFVSGGFDPLDASLENLDRILGAVETYERPGIVANIGQEELKDVSAFSVASVYAPEKYRNHGYGKLLMKLLWEEIERIDGAGFSFLYSDLGAQFYTNFGWTARKSTEIVFSPTSKIPAPATIVAVEAVTDKADGSILQTLVNRDAQLLRDNLRQLVQQQQYQIDPSKTTFVVVTPEIRCFQWLYARAWFNASKVRTIKEPQATIDKDLNFGVYVPGRNDQFVLWHHDFTDDNLFILRWRIETSNDSDSSEHDAISLAFAKAAQEEAKRWDISKIVYWDCDQSLANLLGLKVDERDQSISSLGLINSDKDPQSVEWILNEKYSW